MTPKEVHHKGVLTLRLVPGEILHFMGLNLRTGRLLYTETAHKNRNTETDKQLVGNYMES